LHASFNAKVNKVAFVKNNNLYIKDLITDQIEAITHDGKQNHIINGNCDWVYEEEWEFSQAYQWSPKGSYIAYYRFDESQVKEYNMPFYNSNNTYPSDYKYKYPKAGEANAIVSIKIFNVEHKNTITADIGSETDQYIPRIKWTTHNEQLCIYRMNRLQNHLDLLLTEASTGHSATIYQEDNKYYVPVDDNIAFIPNTTAFIFTSEKSGYTHLYHYDWTQQSMTQLTNGNWEIDNIIGIDVPHKTVYFTAGIAHPTERQLYSINWINKKMETLTHQPGVHQITPCIGYQYFVDKHSGYNNVPIYTLINNKGAAVRVLEDNKTLQETLNQYNLSPITTLQIPNGKGEMLNAWMIKPPHFSPDKKYPVLLYQYSGPGSQEVMDKFPVGNYFWHQMLAQKGYIIVCADGTGTGGRGEAFKKKTYLQLGKLESDDQIAVGKYMAQQHYVDAARIGIWGWSFGGFMSSICIMKGNEVFKTAISVAPVTNWRYYDNIYTERYMRTPKENAAGYDENAPEKMAKLLKGNLLIIHGTADDNVHFQNAIMLTDELIKANKQFESEYYPNKNHGIYGGNTRQQLYQRMTNYILKNL
jgi:dipeptidyl-peptidase-4